MNIMNGNIADIPVQFQCKSCKTFISIGAENKGHEVLCGTCNSRQRVPLQGQIGVGNIIEDHLIEREIGQGAMGKVYLANHLLMNRVVALKTINAKNQHDDQSIDSFIQELQLGAQLSHTNIVTVYTAGFLEGVYYLAMQYVEGEDLKQRLAMGKVTHYKQALNYADKIMDAMAYAWNEFRLIHRDLKPENIKINDNDEPVIFDFGLAKVRSFSEEEEGLAIGTPDFMSPEQASGVSNLDFRSDMYSLGLLLINLITGMLIQHISIPQSVYATNLYINKH